jgi:hypothetical protein
VQVRTIGGLPLWSRLHGLAPQCCFDGLQPLVLEVKYRRLPLKNAD